MKRNPKSKKKRWIVPVATAAAVVLVFLIYFAVYYHAGTEAEEALAGSGGVTVTRLDEGWFFDGPSEEKALIFYPGAKVEAAAYAPLMRDIAEKGADAFLVEMPFNFAFFGAGRADGITAEYDYGEWYMGGHSLGGVVAADYATQHKDIKGLVLFAAYPSSDLRDDLKVLSVYGSKDGVLNRDKYESSRGYLPEGTEEIVIKGGNHSQFGDYGFQDGDTPADIKAQEQREEVSDAVIRFMEQ